MKILYLILLISVFLFACNKNKQTKDLSDKTTNINMDKIVKDSVIIEDSTEITEDTANNISIKQNDTIPVDKYFTDPLVVNYTKHSDTMLINEDCVVFLWPDSLEVVEMQKKYPDGYMEILDDMIYYASDAAIALNGSNIKNFFCDKSIIQFTNTPNDIFLKRKETDGNMIYLKKGKEPFISSTTDFVLETCKHYFNANNIDTLSIE